MGRLSRQRKRWQNTDIQGITLFILANRADRLIFLYSILIETMTINVAIRYAVLGSLGLPALSSYIDRAA
jgi:hypothetical protein